MCSEEVHELYGKVKTHRGTTMTYGSKESPFNRNTNISFSTGFVSHNYSSTSTRSSKQGYLGGVGFFAPLEQVLSYPDVHFSHCCDKGGIENYDLNKKNIAKAVHIARQSKELFDDGYGNVFEVLVDSKIDKESKSMFRKVLSYQRVSLTDVTIAIPESEQETILEELSERQQHYVELYEQISKFTPEKLFYKCIDQRDLLHPEKSLPFIKSLTEPIDLNKMNIFWYKQRNLDVALKYLAIS